MLYRKVLQNPYLLFLPFLIFYVFLVVAYPHDLIVDDDRYVELAQNLLNGFYSPPPPNIDLWWGPGYPIIIAPFLAVGLSLIWVTLLNAVLLYLSVVLLFKAVFRFAPLPLAIGISLFWACSFNMYDEIVIIHTETVSAFLISLIAYSVVNYFDTRSIRYIFYAGVALGYLALTKVFFGYVIVAMLGVCVMGYVIYRGNQNFRPAIYVLLIALGVTIPYLVYTYQLTHRIFYWGNSGGMSLYWMSTPYENEFGDWNYETLRPVNPFDDTSIRLEVLEKNHKEDMEEILQYTGVERDDAYKRLAIRNIKSNPKKFARNIMSNVSRLFFEFPFTYSYQRSQLRVYYFAIFFTLSLFSLVITLLNWKNMPFSIRFLLGLGIIYLAGSSLLSMYNRMLLVMLPLFLVWIAYILNKSISVKYKV